MSLRISSRELFELDTRLDLTLYLSHCQVHVTFYSHSHNTIYCTLYSKEQQQQQQQQQQRQQQKITVITVYLVIVTLITLVLSASLPIC